jgi:hypothetical protein
MSNDQSPNLDILGIKPIGESLKTVTDGSVRGVAAFLSRICLPAAEEFGLLLRDRVRNWRSANVVAVAEEAERLHESKKVPKHYTAHPKLVSGILEHSSWEDGEELRRMWAGLLASSCSQDGKDDSNLLFMKIVSSLTSLQATVLRYSCENTTVRKNIIDLLWGTEVVLTEDALYDVCGTDDLERIDRELDGLRQMELITSGFSVDAETVKADITPTALSLHLYVRTQGWIFSAIDFYQLVDQEPYNPATQKPYPSRENTNTEPSAATDG